MGADEEQCKTMGAGDRRLKLLNIPSSKPVGHQNNLVGDLPRILTSHDPVCHALHRDIRH